MVLIVNEFESTAKVTHQRLIDQLLTQAERRQLTLLQVIQQQQRIEFTEISKLLDWPYVSTQQVFRRVVANYEKITGEHLEKNELVAQCDWVNLKLTAYLVQHSVGYQCLVAALWEQPKPLMHLGPQTIQKRLAPLTEWLRYWRLDYDSQTNQLTGDERIIRLFGWQLYNLGNVTIALSDDAMPFYQQLNELFQGKMVQTASMDAYLRITAVRLSCRQMLRQEHDAPLQAKQNELLKNVSLPQRLTTSHLNLAEVYWLQYMVTYSPYFVDTHKTKLVRAKERSRIPYLIQLIVKTVITRLRVYRSPLYFEELDEYLMECLQLSLLLDRPVMQLGRQNVAKAIPQLNGIVAKLMTDMPELKATQLLITDVLTQELGKFVPQIQVNVGYPEEFDDFQAGILEQQLLNQFMAIDWRLKPLPLVTEVTTPTFRIVTQPEQATMNQYYWVPWLDVTDNLTNLIQKITDWLTTTVLSSAIVSQSGD